MEIKIKMHSQLEDELKPNLRLIKNAIAQIKFENAARLTRINWRL